MTGPLVPVALLPLLMRLAVLAVVVLLVFVSFAVVPVALLPVFVSLPLLLVGFLLFHAQVRRGLIRDFEPRLIGGAATTHTTGGRREQTERLLGVADADRHRELGVVEVDGGLILSAVGGSGDRAQQQGGL